MTTFGFIGVGQMGEPMVHRMLKGGLPVVFHARRPDVVQRVEGAGGTALGSFAEVTAAADVTIICLFSDAQLRELVIDLGVLSAAKPGAVVASHVTGSPFLARELAAALPAGAGYVDAPISGSAEDISNGLLTVLVGGAPDHIEATRPAFETYAKAIVPVGDVGSGQLVKLVNNLAFTINLGLAGEFTRVANAMGVTNAGLVQAIRLSSGQSYALNLLEHRSFAEMAPGALPYLSKDVAVVRSVAAELGVELGQLDTLAAWVDQPISE